MSLAQRMMDLYPSSTRSHGVFRKNAKGAPHHTEHEAYTLKHFEAHIAGREGLGLVPITVDGACWWGAIDIDAHGEGESINIEALYDEVKKHGLPLMVCRSKSGGAHLYLFMSQFIDPKSMRSSLRLMANRIGHPKAEVFPKQDNIDKDRLGNWINLPYFDAETTVRYCWIGKPVTLEFFLDTAEATRCTPEYLQKVLTGDHSEAPPCVQQMITGRVPNGFRNEGLFAIANYMKQAFPDDWKDRCIDINTMTFEQPLPAKEVQTLLTSVGRREYKYRCKEEPCKAFCQAKVCLTRKFGIKPSDDPEEGDRAGMIMMDITGITKVLTEPPLYYVTISGHKVKVRADQLYNPQSMCLVMLEQADKVVYPMKPKEWHNMLANAIMTLQREEAPEDASESGMIRIRLREFLKKARDVSVDEDYKDFLAHGHPVIMEEEGIKYVFFKGTSFVDYLRRTKSSTMQGHNLWAALREHGVSYVRKKINKKSQNLWRIEFEERDPMPTPKTGSEF